MTDPIELIQYCGSHAYRVDQEDQDPLLGMAAEAFEMFGQSQIRTVGRRTDVPLIPVWFHVLWHDPVENVSNNQIYSQIDAWNECMRGINADRSDTPAVFQSVLGDPMMQFSLAGITRTYTGKTSFSVFQDDAKYAAQGGHDVVTPSTHLNFWVIPKLTENYGGYSSFPYGPASTDGIVMVHQLTGSTGTANKENFNLGRTAVHEIGHYFNLNHIWGDEAGCSGSDFVNDTPNQATENYGHPTFPHISCNNGPNGDMFMNFMDYTWDTVTVMYTAGQCTRMDLALKNGRPLLMNTLATGLSPKMYNPNPTSQINKGGLGRAPVGNTSIGRPPAYPPRRFS